MRPTHARIVAVGLGVVSCFAATGCSEDHKPAPTSTAAPATSGSGALPGEKTAELALKKPISEMSKEDLQRIAKATGYQLESYSESKSGEFVSRIQTLKYGDRRAKIAWYKTDDIEATVKAFVGGNPHRTMEGHVLAVEVRDQPQEAARWLELIVGSSSPP